MVEVLSRIETQQAEILREIQRVKTSRAAALAVPRDEAAKPRPAMKPPGRTLRSAAACSVRSRSTAENRTVQPAREAP